MATKIPPSKGAPLTKQTLDGLSGVQGKGLNSKYHADRTADKTSANAISEYKVHDIANRLGGIHIASTDPLKHHGKIPITIHTPSWTTASSSSSSINIRCSCGNINRQPSHLNGSQAKNIDHSSDSDTDEDSDDESFTLGSLMRILRVRDREGEGKKTGATLRNLVESYSCGTDVCANDLMQLLQLITSTEVSVQEAALLTLAKICTCPNNAEKLVQWKTVTRLLILMEESSDSSVVPAVARALQQLTSHTDFKDEWLDLMITDGLAIIMGQLQGQSRDNDTVLAMVNLLIQLAQYFELAVLILDQCMEYIMTAWKSYNVLKRPVLIIFEHLVAHNEHTISAALEHGILHYASIILKDSDCACQVSALKLYLQLSQTPYGLSALLEDNKLTLVLQVTMETHCRETRKLGLATLEKTFELGTPSQVKELLIQVAEDLDHKSHDYRRYVNGCDERPTSGKQQDKNLGKKRTGTQDKLEMGARYLSQVLVHCIRTEGKISCENDGSIISVGYKPNIDQYSCLSHAVSCVFYIASLPVHKHRTRTVSSTQSVRFSKRRPNILTTQYLIQNGVLSLVQILIKYTNYLTFHGLLPSLTQPNSTQHRNLDVLYLKATMKLWQQQTQNLITRKKMAAILKEDEVRFIVQVLNAIEVIVQCCAEVWNRGIEDELAETMVRYKAWEGAGDLNQGDFSYPYVETIDQAFHKSHVGSMKHGLIGGGERRKQAWGDGRKEAWSQQSSTKMGGSRWKDDSSLQLGLSVGVTSDKDQLITQKKMRVGLFKTGLSACAGSLLLCGNTKIQESCLQILRCMCQPFHEGEVTDIYHQSVDIRGIPKMQSKASIAETLAERDRILSLVLEEMSSGTASVVKDALKTSQGLQTKPRPSSATHSKTSVRPSSAKTPQNRKLVPKTRNRPSSATSAGIRNRPSSATSATMEYSTKKLNPPSYLIPELNTKEPMYWQCTMHMLEFCGHHVVHMFRSDDAAIAKAAMLWLYDIVTFGEIISHMKLASIGIMSVLMQVIPQHVDSSQDLALLGLMVLQQLVASEYRLKQLFLAEGGREFLEKTALTSQGSIRAHVDQFLGSFEQGGGEFLEKTALTLQGAIRAHVDQFVLLFEQGASSLY